MKGNRLGDIRAENDSQMLDAAFLETPDYKALLESFDRCVVVGRRGTGKSALVHQLSKYWKKEPNTSVITIAPEEDQIIGLRDLFRVFGETYIHIKAGAKIAWKYALYMELLERIRTHYKLKNNTDTAVLNKHFSRWGANHENVSLKLRKVLKEVVDKQASPETNIADLSGNLSIDELERELLKACEASNHQFTLLVDRLDEGYSPDDLGVSIMDGFVQAVIDLNSKFENKFRGLVFLRDNMFRSISLKDPDFTRNIEGQVLRLHWDEYNLFNMVCNRLKIAFDNDQENSAKVWGAYAARELKGREGFRMCLKLTLYRPRDILVLLNNAFLSCSAQDRDQIVLDDINSSARSISEHRLQDLHKEYESIFPSLQLFTGKFISSAPLVMGEKAMIHIEQVLRKERQGIEVQRDLAIFEDSTKVLQSLYGVGFLGIKDDRSGSYIFCHDGKDPSIEISENSQLFIHPCYWLALNISNDLAEVESAEDIYDEYDIEISSVTKEQRFNRLGKLIEEVKTINPGRDDCHSFEDWCKEAISLIFAGALSNIELHPNKNGLQQRDIVASNMSLTAFWKRVLEDYKSRQIIFEIKNYSELKSQDYRQMLSYLSKDYGKIGFIVCRSKDNNPQKGRELNWAQELHNEHGVLVMKVSLGFLTKQLSKLRSPQKHNAADIELNKLLDAYIRQYLPIRSR